jgi:hypothetical protein
MDIGARPKQLNLLSIDDTSDEMERPSTPADRSRLPASTVDREDNIDDVDDLIDATPSGEHSTKLCHTRHTNTLFLGEEC